tara:strand:+ start:79138 stop:80019 length:882 start_codon:yes stop_codon:yes gene_type:complete
MMPDFVIIGAMKCATSTLHDQLARINGVSMTEPKEPNFFSDELNWAKGMGWYESLFESMPVDDLKGESSTHYTKLPTYPLCIPRMHEHLPNAKLIYVMRDPIDRIVSQYIHEWSQRVIEDGCTIDDAIDRYPMLAEYSKYAMQLSPYVEKWGMGHILPVFFERLMHNPQEEFERVGRFLGITTELQWDMDDAQNVSSQRQRRGPVVNAILGNRVMQAVRRTMLPESLRARIRSRWTMKERPVLSDSSIEKLHGMLDPEMQRLGEWIGRDLTCANYRDVVMRERSPEWISKEAA